MFFSNKKMVARFEVTSTWDIVINLAPAGASSMSGVIAPTIEGLRDGTTLPKNLKVEVTRESYDISLAHDMIQRQIEASMKQTVANVADSLQKKFKAAGRFIYPGMGTIKFEKPYLAKNGSVYCDADFEPCVSTIIPLLLSSLSSSPLTSRQTRARTCPSPSSE